MSANGKTDELTPRQAEFLRLYLDPQSETWSNAYQSAKMAGYEEEYAQNITALMPQWLSDAIGDSKLVTQALQNLTEALTGDDKTIKWDATKFTLKGLKKDKFSERSELTGKDGKELPTPILGNVSTNDSNQENSGPPEAN